MNRIVIAHHLMWTAYGWWLPNDPRESTSHFVESNVIFELGNLHRGRKRVQPASSDIREFYDRASTKLQFALLDFDTNARWVIAEAFADTDAIADCRIKQGRRGEEVGVSGAKLLPGAPGTVAVAWKMGIRARPCEIARARLAETKRTHFRGGPSIKAAGGAGPAAPTRPGGRGRWARGPS